MEKYFVNYKQALALKELGFDEPCFRYIYTGDTGNNIDRYEEVEPSRSINFNHDSLCVSQPLKSQVFEWFRKEHKLRANVMDFIDDITGIEWDYEIATIGTDLDETGNYIPLVDYSIDDEMRKFKTYEEAESACIDKLIEIIKNK